MINEYGPFPKRLTPPEFGAYDLIFAPVPAVSGHPLHRPDDVHRNGASSGRTTALSACRHDQPP